MAFIVAGGAGFIGTNFINKISKYKKQIFIIDKLSEFKNSFKNNLGKDQLKYFECDLSNSEQTNITVNKIKDLSKTEISIWHFAANSDIPKGIIDPFIDMKDTFLSTFNLLNCCKKYQIKSFFFASSSAIYGDHGDKKIKECTGPLIPISNYGAMKLASEAQCLASYENFLDNLRIYRFPNVVGAPATHGVIYDFIRKLKINPNQLDVLGDGNQTKAYLHVDDLIDGMLFLAQKELISNETPLFNLGPNDNPIKVSWIAKKTVNIVSPNAKINFGKSKRGWVGDVPKFSYDTEKAKKAGWEPKLSSKKAVEKAIKEIFFQLGK